MIHSLFRKARLLALATLAAIGSLGVATAQDPSRTGETHIPDSVGIKPAMNVAQSPCAAPTAAGTAAKGAAPAEPLSSGKPLGYWSTRARDRDQHVRYAAAQALGKLGQPALPAIRELTKDEDALVRDAAVEALGAIGPPALPALAELSKDKDQSLRFAAARRLATSDRPRSRLLCNWPRTRMPTRVLVAAVALGVMGPAAKDAIPTLAELGRDPRVCGDAALALSRVGPAAIPALTELLKEQNDRVRARAAWALGMIGPAAREAIPTLAGMLKHGGNDAPTAAKASAR